MEPEQTPEVVLSEKEASTWNTVTPFSKYLAMVLFVALPFIGGWVGYTLASEKVVEVNKFVEVENQDTPSLYIVEYESIAEPEYRHEDDYKVFSLVTQDKESLATSGQMLLVTGSELVDANFLANVFSVLESNGIETKYKTIKPYIFGQVSNPSYGESIEEAGVDYVNSGDGLLLPDMVKKQRDDGKTSQFFSNSPLYFKLYSPHKLDGIFAYYPFNQQVEWLEDVSSAYGSFSEKLIWGEGHAVIQNNGSELVFMSLYADEVITLVEVGNGESFADNCMYGCTGEMEIVELDSIRTNDEVLRYAVYKLADDETADGAYDNASREIIEYREINLLDFIESQN